jgi:predicted AAA+ superfamily ATPase
MWGQIKKSDKLVQLLQALSYQLGSEVSYHELGNTVGLASETVASYVQLLEQSFILFRLPPLSRNLRKELKTKRKIYFYDNGIRNAVISQFQPVELRQDIGALWENWLISERRKTRTYQGIFANSFFWRTQDQQEIDYIEERDGYFHAFEMKWNPNATARFSKTFTRAYPAHTTTILHRDAFEAFLGVET